MGLSRNRFRIFRIPAPGLLWIGCPYRSCKGFEAETGIDVGELLAAIKEHERVHKLSEAPWMIGGRIPRADPHRKVEPPADGGPDE